MLSAKQRMKSTNENAAGDPNNLAKPRLVAQYTPNYLLNSIDRISESELRQSMADLDNLSSVFMDYFEAVKKCLSLDYALIKSNSENDKCFDKYALKVDCYYSLSACANVEGLVWTMLSNHYFMKIRKYKNSLRLTVLSEYKFQKYIDAKCRISSDINRKFSNTKSSVFYEPCIAMEISRRTLFLRNNVINMTKKDRKDAR